MKTMRGGGARSSPDEGRGAVQVEEQGERSSFDAVYKAEWRAVTGLAFLFVRSLPVAEELAQEAFARLYGTFDAVDNPAAFLRTAVSRLALNALRHSAVERRYLQGAGAGTTGPAAPDGMEPHALSRHDEMWEALGRLRPERRAVLVLRFYEDMTHEQIAEVLRCSAGTVRSRVRRAIADLRKDIDR
jgi:RNA polymerase sigma factor (sigma-70 family)